MRRPAAHANWVSPELVRFGLCIATIAAIWLVLLPWLASWESVDARLRWLEARGIDPSAMYYTELDAMRPILDKIERNR